ncbi:MAG: T9SS type A sorting domain-containing protein [Prevotella sp.]|jgi:photosystem II stability/assembly factor-like uncharacterized protein
MKKYYIAVFVGLAFCCQTEAQIYFTSDLPSLSSVTNDGRVVGTTGQNKPFQIWNYKDNTLVEIGGCSAGQGVGGQARFSDDGSFIVGPMYNENLPMNTDWHSILDTTFSCHFTDYCVSPYGYLFVVGTKDNDSTGVILRSTNKGGSWRTFDQVYTSADYKPEAGMLSIAAAGPRELLVGGYNGKVYVCTSSYWSACDPHPAGDSTAVKAYTAMDFAQDEGSYYCRYCLLGLEFEDNTGAIWYSADTATTFNSATGVNGVPVKIAHAGTTFFLVTADGLIQKSTDHGATWTDVFQTEDGSALKDICFGDSLNGLVLGDTKVYFTTDGGNTWTENSSLTLGDASNWNSATWFESTVMLAGDKGLLYQSKDNGNTFTQIDMGTTDDFELVIAHDTVYSVLANTGLFYNKSDIETKAGYCAGKYSIEDDTWTPLASTGFIGSASSTSPWNVSGDGKTIVGLGYYYSNLVNKTQAHASYWNEAGELTDLGTLYEADNQNTRANAVNYDGSVIVGWQDMYGPWYAAMWKRGDDGSYTQEMMLADESYADSTIDFTNAQNFYLGYAQAITPDGKWVGGYAETWMKVPGAWIWNEEQGVIQLTDQKGCVIDMSNDASVVIGYHGSQTEAWIWTGDSVVNLGEYVTNVLNYDLDGYTLKAVYDMSANGRYIIGLATKDNTRYGYILDLDAEADGIEQQAIQVKAAVYPNPVSDVLHISLPYDASEVPANIMLYDYAGHCVKAVKAQGVENQLSVNNLSEGIYLLRVEAGKFKKTFKVVIRH